MAVVSDDIRKILLSTELGGREIETYRINLAVGNSDLGTSYNKNYSGFTFGVVQLDIGSNEFAKQAYEKIILHSYLIEREISSSQFDKLMKYLGTKRPDLDKDLALTYKDDREFLNSNIFNKQYAHDYIDAVSYTHLTLPTTPYV